VGGERERERERERGSDFPFLYWKKKKHFLQYVLHGKGDVLCHLICEATGKGDDGAEPEARHPGPTPVALAIMDPGPEVPAPVLCQGNHLQMPWKTGARSALNVYTRGVPGFQCRKQNDILRSVFNVNFGRKILTLILFIPLRQNEH
jgi:hypothetical protein